MPTFAHSARVVSVTSASVETVETTSTSFITVAGLKKCMPMTSCGAAGRLGHRDDRQRGGRGRQDRAPPHCRGQISSRFSNNVVLIGEVLGDRLDDDVDVGEVVERGGAAGDRPSTSALASSVARPRWICLSKFFVTVATTPSTLSCERPTIADVVAGLGEDLDDAGGHRAGADDADLGDVVLAAAGPRRPDGVWSSATTAGLSGRLVGVEAAAGLAAQQAGGDHLLEDRGRRVQPVAPLAVHRLEDLVGRVETDQVEQRQRTHRVAAAEPHGGVDVLAGGVAAPRTSTPRG